jgi:hypothetical protein
MSGRPELPRKVSKEAHKELPEELPKEVPNDTRDGAAKHEDRDVQAFEYSGIRERKGKVNTWLIVVYVAVGIWSVWYLIAYWTKS